MSGPLDDATITSINPQPGETVVVTLPKPMSQRFIGDVGDQLKQAFPDNRCVVMEEGTSLSVEDDPLSRADVIAAIEKRQDFNTSGGSNWGPANSAKAKNQLLITLLVDLDLMSEDEAKESFSARHQEYERRTTEAVERYNAERRAEGKS